MPRHSRGARQRMPGAFSRQYPVPEATVTIRASREWSTNGTAWPPRLWPTQVTGSPSALSRARSSADAMSPNHRSTSASSAFIAATDSMPRRSKVRVRKPCVASQVANAA